MATFTTPGGIRRATVSALAAAGVTIALLAGAAPAFGIVFQTSTIVTSSQQTIDLGATVDLSATVDGSVPTAPQPAGTIGAPTGTVAFFYCYNASLGLPNCPEGARVAIGTPVALAPGAGTSATASIPAWTPAEGRGWYVFAAVYNGDSSYPASEDAGSADIAHLYVNDPNALPSEVTVSDHAPGRGQTVTVCVLHLPVDGSASIGVEAWGIDEVVAADETGAACLDITVPSDAEAGSYTVTFAYSDANAQPLFTTETLVVFLPGTDTTGAAAASLTTGSPAGFPVQDDSRSPWIVVAALAAVAAAFGWTRRTARHQR